MLFVIMIFSFGSVVVLSRLLLAPAVTRLIEINQKRSEKLAHKMDEMFIKVKVNRIALFFFLGPIVLGMILFVIFPTDFRPLGLIAGFFIGLLIPSVYVKILEQRRKDKFENQLIDTLMIMSSCLKGGLSLIQALEVVTEEIPEPMNQEIGILLGENKMGISIEDAFAHLYNRMPSSALQQMITAVLLARETGGNLPVIFARIVQTIRENKKIRENLRNLTLQGRIQGVVMVILPVAFAGIVTSTNPKFFDQMTQSQIGRYLLIYCAISETIGALLIWKISTYKDF